MPMLSPLVPQTTSWTPPGVAAFGGRGRELDRGELPPLPLPPPRELDRDSLLPNPGAALNSPVLASACRSREEDELFRLE